MIEITISNPNDKDSFEKALKIFEKKCSKDGFLKEIRDRRYFKKPSEINREKIRQSKRKEK